MKVSRPYLLGLGSGLILSALLSVMLPPMNAFTGRDRGGGGAPTEKTDPAEKASALGAAGAASQENARPRIPAEAGKAGPREFAVPSGASAEKIAGLLQEQGFIADKKAFLDVVEKKRVASRFQVGTFTLVQNLSPDEIVNILLVPKQY